MNSFYKKLKENNNIEFLKANIDDFNNLSDDEINLLFESETISNDFKTIIAEFCYTRINQLSFEIFTNCISYINDSNVFILNYGNRINAMSYEEMVSLIYAGFCSSECLLALTKTEGFNSHLNNEKETKSGTKLQSFLLSSKIHLANDNLEELELIGYEIKALIYECGNEQYTEDIDMLVNSYLSQGISNINKLDIEGSMIKSCFAMVNYSLKCHRLIDFKMIEFYILYRIKDLNLSGHCKEIVISDIDEPRTFGNFTISTGTLRIFYNYLENRFRPLLQQNNITDEKSINDFLNVTFFQLISHEIGHVVDGVKINEYQNKNNTAQFFDKIKSSDFLNYWYRNGKLRMLLGDDGYYQNHGKFINENRADLFSFFDSSIQINKNLKEGFTDLTLQIFSQHIARRVVDLYTETTEKGLETISPMQKFDKFFRQMLPEDTEFLNQSNIDNNEQTIMNNLLIGNVIPEYVLIELLKIANGERATTDLFSELQLIVSKSNSSGLQDCNLMQLINQCH